MKKILFLPEIIDRRPRHQLLLLPSTLPYGNDTLVDLMSQISLSHPAPVSQASAPASDVLIGNFSTSARSNQDPTSKLADPSLDLLAATTAFKALSRRWRIRIDYSNQHCLVEHFPRLVPTYIELTHSIPPPCSKALRAPFPTQRRS